MSRTSAKRFVQFVILAVVAGELSHAAAEVLILRSDGPTARRQFRVGSRVPDTAVFNLRPGDSLTVLARGGTRSFRGPGAFSVVAPPQSQQSAQNAPQVRIQTGVVRRDPPVPGVEATDIWEYDVRQEGTVCVRAGARPILWLPADHGTARLTISTVAGAMHTSDWPAGQTSFAWPDSVPVTNGTSYTLSWSGDARPTRITARVLTAAEADSLDTLASTLIRNGCFGQLDTFIATRVDPDAPIAQTDAERARGTPPPRQ